MHWRCYILLAGFSASFPAYGFNYFEHRFLGNQAFANAREMYVDSEDSTGTAFLDALDKATQRIGFGQRANVPHDERSASPGVLAGRSLDDIPLQFGDLTALAADLTIDPDDLRKVLDGMQPEVVAGKRKWYGDPTRAQSLIMGTRQQWLSACKWLYRTRHDFPRNETSSDADCFKYLDNKGITAPPLHRFGAQGYSAPRQELADFEKVPMYVTLVAQNQSHFARYSWKEYSRYHRRALELARCFVRNSKCDGSNALGEDLLVDALVNEAFAQHYLHDSFSAGHIGTKWGTCYWRLCNPPKAVVKQTHDTLDEGGLDVTLVDPPRHLGDVSEIVRHGWTSFGDDHLFIREADFHRVITIRTATASVRELFDTAAGRDSGDCEMCTTSIFPVPDARFLSADSRAAVGKIDEEYKVGDLVMFESSWGVGNARSLDHRVPDVTVEGWKVGAAFAVQFRGSNSDNGMLFKLDYLRNAEPKWLSTLGFEYWNLPERGESYVFTFGYLWPRELTNLQIGVKGKFGWRTEDNFTDENPSSNRRGGVQLSFPSVEITYEVFSPVAFFLQINPATVVFRGEKARWETPYSDEYSIALGLRLDLSEVIR